MILYNELTLSKKEKVEFLLGGGMGFGMIGYLFYQNIVVSCMSFCLIIFLMKYYRKGIINRRKLGLNLAFKDALYIMSASIAAGRQLDSAIIDAAENLTSMYGKDSDIVREFIAMKVQIEELNIPPEEVLRDFAARSGLEDIENFALVCGLCIKTGGDMEGAINKTVKILCDKINIRKEIAAATSQKKLESRILFAMPLGILFFLQFFSSDYIQIMYLTAVGRVIMTVCLSILIGSFYWCHKISAILV